MIHSIVPVGDGITILLSAIDAAIVEEGEMLAVDATDSGIAIMFGVMDLPYSLVLPYDAAAYLSETEEGNVYVYGLSEESIVAQYACQLIVDKSLLFKALGAWEALYGNRVDGLRFVSPVHAMGSDVEQSSV